MKYVFDRDFKFCSLSLLVMYPILTVWKIGIWMSKIAKNLTLKKKIGGNFLPFKSQFSGRSGMHILTFFSFTFVSVCSSNVHHSFGHTNLPIYILILVLLFMISFLRIIPLKKGTKTSQKSLWWLLYFCYLFIFSNCT